MRTGRRNYTILTKIPDRQAPIQSGEFTTFQEQVANKAKATGNAKGR